MQCADSDEIEPRHVMRRAVFAEEDQGDTTAQQYCCAFVWRQTRWDWLNSKLYQFVYRLEYLKANHSHCMNRNNVSCASPRQPQQRSSWPSLSFPQSSSKCSYSFTCPERTNVPINSYLKFRGFSHPPENLLQQERVLTAMFYFQYFYVYRLHFQQCFADDCAKRKGP